MRKKQKNKVGISDSLVWGAPPGRSQSCASSEDQILSQNLPLPRQHTGLVLRDPDKKKRW